MARRSLEHLSRVLEDHFRQGRPEMVDRREFFHRYELSAERLLGHRDLDHPTHSSGVDVGPSHLLALADLVAADVLNVFEFDPALFEGLANHGFQGRLIRLDSATGNAPPAIFDIADEDLLVEPGENEAGKGPQRRTERSREELQLLPSIRSDGKLLQFKMTFPMTRLSSTGPNRRLSSETARLSPRTNIWPAGTR